MALSFQKATKKSARLRMALIGVAGAGKTYTALSIAQHLGKRIAVVDTERGSASKYSDIFQFDVLEVDTYSPRTYIEAIEAAEEAGYDVLIIDSLSHAWAGRDGALEMVDKASRRQQSGNNFGAWRDVTPLHNAMVDKIIGARLHIIGTMRAKTEYVQEKNEKTGKTTVRKVGLAPVQRDGLEYEFDVVADIDSENNFIVGKTRCPQLSGVVVNKAGREIAQRLQAWLTDGGETMKFETPPAPPRVAEKKTRRPEPIEVVEEPEAPAPATKLLEVEDQIHCDCGGPAKYVRGRSGAGWVCTHFGTSEPNCSFRMKDASVELATDPFEDAAALNGAHA